jgi:hypothetical protein
MHIVLLDTLDAVINKSAAGTVPITSTVECKAALEPCFYKRYIRGHAFYLRKYKNMQIVLYTYRNKMRRDMDIYI